MAVGSWSKPLALILAFALAGCNSEEPGKDGAAINPESERAVPADAPEVDILAFGDSLFAGYGVKKSESYPARLEDALRARGFNANVVNAGVSGDTSAAGRQRLAFTLDAQTEKPDLVILELGGNDLLRGLPPAETRANFEAMLDELKKRDIDVLLMGMRSPPNYGGEFTAQFDGLYPALAKEYGADLVPFFLEAIYTDPGLFQNDRIHPTPQGIDLIVADTVDEVEEALD